MIQVGDYKLTPAQEQLVHIGLLTLFWEYRSKPEEQAPVSELLEQCKIAMRADLDREDFQRHLAQIGGGK